MSGSSGGAAAIARSEEEASVPTIVLKEGDITTEHTVNDDAGGVIPVTIRLSLQEESLIETILEATQYLEEGKLQQLDLGDSGIELRHHAADSNHNTSNRSSNLQVEVRIAGGWVRDKLLGIATHDVDIAVDTLSGVQFATAVQAFLNMKHPNQVHKMGVIAANPNQSKHLETATMVVMGMECDFCNLRTQEIYTDDSRIPDTVSFGTPLEDAQRRDFSLNALFFNLKTKRVEDWTRRGLPDLLIRKLLVTPLDPFTTFHDDPLRVLRAIRFAVRLDYQLDTRLREAASAPAIQQALLQKVSRERVGKELEGMLSGKGAKPTKALDLIGSLNLSQCVFTLPDKVAIQGYCEEEQHRFQMDTVSELWKMARETLLPRVESVQEKLTQHSQTTSSTLDARIFAMAAYLLPFRHLYFLDKKAKKVMVVEFMMRESIKFKNKDVAVLVTLMEHVDSFVKLLHESSKVNRSRLELGLLLRCTKDQWVTCLCLAAVLAPTVDQMEQLYDAIVIEFALESSWKTRPLLDGRALIEALSLPKGPIVGTYLEEEVRWMLVNRDGTADACLEHLKTFKMQEDAANKRPLDGKGTTEESKRACT